MCKNDGVCSLVGYNYKCSCFGYFFGKNCQYKILNSTIFKNSTILTDEQGLDLVNLVGLEKKAYQLLYQSSRDGFNTTIFHSKCDDAAQTLTIIKSLNSNIFGGYTSANWSGKAEQKLDSTAFLFSLVNKYNVSVKMNITVGNYAIYSNPLYGFVFGGGWDLYCDKNQCYSTLGTSYQLPSFLSLGSNDAYNFLAGNSIFVPVEIEVYWIT